MGSHIHYCYPADHSYHNIYKIFKHPLNSNKMEKVNIANYSQAELKELRLQLEQQEKADKKKRLDDIESLKEMQDQLCASWLSKLLSFSEEQTKLVDAVFNDTAPLISLKSELYDVKENQGSHTFTARDGSGSITVGHNMIIGFDGTSDIGVQKIQGYLSSLSKDDANRVKIEAILNVLMKRNKLGNLNPTRIVDLANLKSEINDYLFSEGVDIVVASQFKTRTSSYVEGWIRKVDQNNKETKVQFRITAK
jgi:hypothetical protein